MLKPVIAATAMLALAGSSFAYAQQRFDGRGGVGDGPRAEHQHHRLSADDISAFADARIAALKAGLELTPDQAKNWPPFESALHNMAQLRVQRMLARQTARQQSSMQSEPQEQGHGQAQQGQPQTQGQAQPQTQNQAQPQAATPFDRMGRRADAMSKMSAALKQIADTGAPLYQSLTEDQKGRFTMLARMLRPHQHQHAFNGGGWREGRGDRGPAGRGWGEGGRRFGQEGHGWDRGGGRFGQEGQGGDRGGRRFGQQGQGWDHGGRRFGQDGEGRGHGHRYGENDGSGGQRHSMMGSETDQDSDSQL